VPGADDPLGLAAGGEPHVALLVHKHGEAEGEALHPPRREPELVCPAHRSQRYPDKGSVLPR
jgi:hypothetical protein